MQDAVRSLRAYALLSVRKILEDIPGVVSDSTPMPMDTRNHLIKNH